VAKGTWLNALRVRGTAPHITDKGGRKTVMVRASSSPVKGSRMRPLLKRVGRWGIAALGLSSISTPATSSTLLQTCEYGFHTSNLSFQELERRRTSKAYQKALSLFNLENPKIRRSRNFSVANILLDEIVRMESHILYCKIKNVEHQEKNKFSYLADFSCNYAENSFEAYCYVITNKYDELYKFFGEVSSLYSVKMKVSISYIRHLKSKYNCKTDSLQKNSIEFYDTHKSIGSFVDIISNLNELRLKYGKWKNFYKLDFDWMGTFEHPDWPSFRSALLYSCVKSNESKFDILLSIQCKAAGLLDGEKENGISVTVH
jgi:hypothetical protein